MTTTPVDAVEIKCTLSGSLDAAVASFHLDRDPDREREIWFFDRLDAAGTAPQLLRAGVILRLRRKTEGRGETTLKLRPARAELLVGDFRAGSGQFGENYSVEWDWAHDQVLSASMDADVSRDTADAMVIPGGLTRARFSADQLRLLDEAGAPPPGAFDGLNAAGPIESARWDKIGVGQLAKLRAERWTYDDKQFLELSVQAADLTEGEALRDALLDDVERRGLEPDPAGRSKTETVLLDLLTRRA
jgi:hypothetical protein